MSTRRPAALAVSVLLTFLATLPVARGAEASGDLAPLEGTWSGRIGWKGDTVDLRLEWTSESGRSTFRERRTVPLAELTGADPGSFSRPWAPLHFEWSRDAGKLDFTGEGAWFFRPGGKFTFQPDPGFAEKVRAAGALRTDPRTLFFMALQTTPVSLVSALGKLGYEDVDIDDVVRLGRHGIDGDYVAAAAELGERPDLDEIDRLHSRGVSAEDLRSFAANGLGGIDAESLMRLKSQGIDAAWVAAMASAGLGTDDVEALVRLHQHGVSPDEATGYLLAKGIDVDTEGMIRLKSAGVSPGYLQEITSSGVAQPDIEKVIRLQQRGIDPATARDLAALGFTDIEGIVRLRSQGVSADEIAGFRKAGYGDLDVEDLVRLHTHGVDPAFAAKLTAGGISGLSVDDLIRLHQSGDADRLIRNQEK
ncbi:MAG TPA: hypothetical protein VNI57_08465 [Candidatus Saccharimonadales bacterium]|nr:hypothetical protein [Candidatus Saccharimonadales bacterium]